MTDALKIALVAAGPPTLVAGVAAYAAITAHTRLQEIHVLVNSRLSTALEELKILREELGKKPK